MSFCRSLIAAANSLLSAYLCG